MRVEEPTRTMGVRLPGVLRFSVVHRVPLFAAALFFVGCASADEARSTAAEDAAAESASDTSVVTDAAVDSAVTTKDAEVVDVDPDVIFPVEDVGPPGTCGVPPGTTASASATGGSNVPANAIDGKTTTYWSSGATSGTLRLNFPAVARFDRVRIAARTVFSSATPTFTLTGRVGKTGSVIGTAKPSVSTTSSWLPEINVTAGGYDGLDIAIASSSLVLIAEVYVYDSASGCTPP